MTSAVRLAEVTRPRSGGAVPTDEELVLGRFVKQREIGARLGGRAFLAGDSEASGALVEVHVLPLETPQAAVQEALRAVDALAATRDPSLPKPIAVTESAD